MEGSSGGAKLRAAQQGCVLGQECGSARGEPAGRAGKLLAAQASGAADAMTAVGLEADISLPSFLGILRGDHLHYGGVLMNPEERLRRGWLPRHNP
jgi:hypothetical protein